MPPGKGTPILPEQENPEGSSFQGTASTPVHLSMQVSGGTRLRVRVEARKSRTSHEILTRAPLSQPQPGILPRLFPWQIAWNRLVSRLKQLPWLASLSFEALLFGMALLLYLATRFAGLQEFPIYFFTDEAAQTVLAADLVDNHLFGDDGDFLPTFFKNGGKYRLGFTVYAQVLPYVLFGKSVFATRATSVLISLLGALAVALTLRDVFKIPYWWCGALLLSTTPAWFLHSRTAFEYCTAVSFYALFLYFYLVYRTQQPRYLYLSLLAGALAFYSYSPMQMVILVSGIALLVVDFRYHRQNRGLAFKALVWLGILAIPYIRFFLTHSDENLESLRALSSYWLMPIPLSQKIGLFVSKYFAGLNPLYWFFPNNLDLPRHIMKGYGHLSLAILPFALIGLWITFSEIRKPAYRALVVGLLAAPSGAALVDVGVTRALVFIVPAVLLAALGLAKVIGWLERHNFPRLELSIGLFVAFTVVNLVMTYDALAHGPTWFPDYGLYGMQYGARQVTDAVKEYLADAPGTPIIISPNWANGIIELMRFFLPYEPLGRVEGDLQSLQSPPPIYIASIDWYLNNHLPIHEKTLFVLTPEDYQNATTSGKFEDINVERVIPYPNGAPGFYFVRLRYVDDIDAILAAEAETRQQLNTEHVALGSTDLIVRHSRLDMGAIGNIFDDDPDTLIRTQQANPAFIEITFPVPRQLRGITLNVGTLTGNIKAQVFTSLQETPVEFTSYVDTTIDHPEARLDFAGEYTVQILRIEIEDITRPDFTHIHLWEVRLY